MASKAANTRCPWCGSDPDYIRYHDEEWGVPVHDDRHLFEMLILEGAQAGLSWLTILRKRDNYRRLFHNFEIEKVARLTAKDAERLLLDPGIVRNRLKVAATIDNAKAALKLREQGRTLDQFLWQFVNGKPKQGRRDTLEGAPTSTPESDAMSKELKRLGFRFVGTTICHAFMQAVGMVNDHLVTCPRHAPVAKLGK